MEFDEQPCILWAHSSSGRAPALQAGGGEFESRWVHHLKPGGIAQLAEQTAVNR